MSNSDAWLDEVEDLFLTGSTAKACNIIEARTAQEVQKARIDELENMLGAQDQEVDLDGRPMFPPYYVINGDGERYMIESRITALQLSQEEPKKDFLSKFGQNLVDQLNEEEEKHE